MRHKLHCKQLLSPLLSLVLVSMLLPRANAENGAATRTVRVAFPEQAGMSIIGHEGKVTGCNYDHLEKISEYTGWQMDYIAYPDDDGTAAVIRALQDLEDGKVDLVGPLLKNKATEALYEFPERSYGMVYTTLCALASGDLRETNIKLHGKLTVGLWEQAVTRNSEVIAYLDAERFDYELIYYPTVETQTQALYDGSVDLISSVSLSPITNTRIVEQFAARPFYFASTKGNTALIEELNAAIFALLYARQMSKKNKELRIANDAKSEFLSRMSHDIRTPMNGIVGMLDISDKNADDPETVRRCHRKILDASDYLLALINDVLGMSKAFQSKMFEPFAQERSDSRSEYRGTGLGLAIVKKIIDQMHGDISVDSAPGAGMSIVWTLKFRIDKDYHELPAAQEAEPLNLTGSKVLAAEDNELNAEILQMMLRQAGADVTLVENGELLVKAFEAAAPNTYDYIFTDIMMPVMDGYEACRRIRALDRPDTQSIPIIAMTANAFAEDVQRSLDAGMDAHISKPFDLKKLQQCLAKLSQKRV